MIKILFVCHGNICRSPMAEFIMKNLVLQCGKTDRYRISSAATSREEIGNGMYPPAERCLRSHQVPVEKRRARQISKTDLEEYDLIIAMERLNLRNLERLLGPSEKYSLLMNYTGRDEDINDPWWTDDFETAYSQIEEGCKALLSTLESVN